MIQLKIKVTKEVIKRAQQCGHDGDLISENCAVALACKEIWPECSVSREYIATYVSAGAPSIVLPKEASDWIERFDCALPIDRPTLPELEFTIDVPDSIISEVNIDEVRELLKDSKTMEVV